MENQFSVKQASFLILVTLTGIISSVILHISLVFGILPGLIFLIVLSLKRGYEVRNIMKLSYQGMGKVKIVLFILFLISFLLPSWYLSGTITSMVSITLQAINPHHFFVFCFLTTMIFSMILGSSIGTLSALGVPLISSAILLHIPVEISAGAVISGAFVGDRTSPFSSAHQLLANILETTVKKQGKAMLFTSITAVIVTIIFFSVMDLQFAQGITQTHHEIVSNKNISFIQFIPPILLVVLVLFRINIIYSYVISILSGSLIALFNGTSFSKIVNSFWHGINGLGGGLSHMYSLLLFIAVAGIYNALLEELNIIQPMLDKWLQTSTSMLSDSLKTIGATAVICVIAGNQTMPIILTGRSFLAHWSNKYNKEELARLMADTTLLFPAMIPWNVLAIMSSTVINMKLHEYLPYAIFLWLLPCLTIFINVFKKVKTYETKYEVSS
ncbi:Na+/H+ antiporter NhaC family protein [Gottfriedia acidiceleris]|uniref:Na+/H+ antiporter NhaC family protein n=1 Tax=Gottfriedia acidiceleris TaxID=371036 RepID=UPI00300081F8